MIHGIYHSDHMILYALEIYSRKNISSINAGEEFWRRNMSVADLSTCDMSVFKTLKSTDIIKKSRQHNDIVTNILNLSPS